MSSEVTDSDQAVAGNRVRMANSVVIIKVGPRADEILDEFEKLSGLSAQDEGRRRIFEVHAPEEHEVKIVETLSRADEHWADHLAFDKPREA